jgi:hypothetical protein
MMWSERGLSSSALPGFILDGSGRIFMTPLSMVIS